LEGMPKKIYIKKLSVEMFYLKCDIYVESRLTKTFSNTFL
jgi:hypothetical protein